MAMTTSKLRSLLDWDEPDYLALARLGPAILPQLGQLVTDRSDYVAANAASLAGMIGGERALSVLARAVRSASGQVRTAAAGALRHVQSPKASGLIAALLSDRDKGVRKFAIKAAAGRPDAALAAKIADLAKREPLAHLRSLASQAMGRTRLA